MTMNSFKIKAYGKSELAALYLPNANSTDSARRTMIRWINRNKELKRKLHACGYNPLQRTFYPNQVKLIVAYLGEP